MGNLAHRRDIIITKATDNDLQPSSATVHVLPPGGTVVSVAYSTATVLGVLIHYTDFTLQAGHGLAAQQRFIIGTDETTFGQILTALSTNVLRAQGTYNAAAGDLLVNLGGDTGSTSPNWDDATIPVYSTSDGSGTALAPSSVVTNSEGEYQYWISPTTNCWEVTRSGNATLDVIQGAWQGRPTGLSIDTDSDGTAELFTGQVSGYDRVLNSYDTVDMTAVGGTTTYTGFRQEINMTGSTAQTFTREGIFSILRLGATSSGANSTGGNSGGSAIAAGNYVEYRGDGTQSTNSLIGTESAMTMYNQGSVAGAFGLLGICSVDNSGAGGTATITTGYGVRGIARILSGTGAYTNAIGVDGNVNIAGAGTMTNAIAGRFNVDSSGGTITSAYGVQVLNINSGATNNYGVYIEGASGGSSLNAALWVDTGNVYIRDSAGLVQIRGNNIYFGDGTDKTCRIQFDTSTSDGIFGYIGAGAVNEFEFNKTVRQVTPQGALWKYGQAEELITLSTSGLTTDSSADLLPANAIIEAVCCRVTTTITTTTDWAVGDPTTSNRFSAANSTLTSGTTSVGLRHWNPTVATTEATGPTQTSAAKVRITCTGSNPGAGAIRVTVFYRVMSAATS